MENDVLVKDGMGFRFIVCHVSGILYRVSCIRCHVASSTFNGEEDVDAFVDFSRACL